MDNIAPALFLMARFLVMAPEGTQTLSEHQARVPIGATGLIQERFDAPGFPGAVRVYISPGAAAGAGGGAEGEVAHPIRLKLELWRDPEGPVRGRPADEVNEEEALLTPPAGFIVQIAEDAGGERRLVLSIREGSAPPALPPSTAPPAAPREVAFRVEVQIDRDGAREIVQTHMLRTLEGRPISWENEWRFGGLSRRPGGEAARLEKVTLTVQATSPAPGWMNVEGTLEATIRGDAEGASPPPRSTASRLLPAGVPFELTLDAPSPPRSDAATGEPAPKLRYILQITPYLPTPGS